MNLFRRDALVRAAVVGGEMSWSDLRNSDGKTRTYESELHPRQPRKDMGMH